MYGVGLTHTLEAKMNRKYRSLVLAGVVIVASIGVIVGGTYALFVQKTEVNNHLSAGSLNVGLKRVAYTEKSLGENGLLKTITNDIVVDLLKDSSSIFDIENAVPTSCYVAGIEISNIGNVAFDYSVKFLVEEKYEESKLSEQLKITLTAADVGVSTPASYSFMLNTAIESSDLFELGYILAGSSAQTFTITVEFVDDEENNLAQGDEIEFDVQVIAVQKVTLD